MDLNKPSTTKKGPVKRLVHRCLSCGGKMRGWHTEDFESPLYTDKWGITRHYTKFVTMCITNGCMENGKVYRSMEFPLRIECSINIK